MGSITSANVTFLLAVTGLFNAPQQIQGFAADNIFTTDDIQSSETMMGVDGHLAAGFVNMPVPMKISLMADSPSNGLFESWAASNKINQDLLFANATVLFPSLKKKWALTKGSLTGFKAMPDAGKVLQPRAFGILWESVLPANI